MKSLEIEIISRLIEYNSETGVLLWKPRTEHDCSSHKELLRWNSRYSGKEAFRINANGYRTGMIFRSMYTAHRIAWCLYYRSWPEKFIDHINGDRSDNRIINLREVTKSENSRNAKISKANKSGATGVSKTQNGKFRSYISNSEGKIIQIGTFEKFEDACFARKKAEKIYNYHPSHGSR